LCVGDPRPGIQLRFPKLSCKGMPYEATGHESRLARIASFADRRWATLLGPWIKAACAHSPLFPGARL